MTVSTIAIGQQIPKKVKLPDILEEASGLYIDEGNKLWWINDSGNAPALYVTNAKGELQSTINLKAINNDWEDLTHDTDGNIYIGEFGNNANKRKNLKVYRYNPISEALDSIAFTYPDQTEFPPPSEQRNFNMEGFIWLNNKLHLFSKNSISKGNDYSKHYTLSTSKREQVAELRDSVLLKNRVVTAAAISPDRQTVVLLTYDFKVRWKFFPRSKVSLFIIKNFKDDDFLSGTITEQRVRFFAPVTQYECVDFIDNETVLIASEKTILYKQKAKRIKLKKGKQVTRASS